MVGPFARIFARLAAVGMVFCLSASLLSACGSSAVTPGMTTASSFSQPVSPMPSPVSGELRVWITPIPAALNPLLDADRTHRALFRLVYQGLFHLSEDQSATNSLCQDWSLSSDGITLTIQLVPDVTFHDGSLLAAGDVAASFRAIRAAGASSPYASDLSNVAGITAVTDTTLRVDLIRPDAFVRHSLTFPVIPAKYAGSTAAAGIPPGTGPYQFVSPADAKGIRLTRYLPKGVTETYRIDKIYAAVYPDIRHAIEALQDDHLDLVDLNADEYLTYRYRQDIAIYPYAGSRFVFLAMNSGQGKNLAGIDAYRFVRLALDRVRASGIQDAWPFSLAGMPSIPRSEQLAGEDAVPGISPEPSAGYAWPAKQSLSLLYPSSDPVRKEIAERAVKALEADGVRVVQIPADDTVYAARMAAKAYDIAVCEATVPRVPDPGWLYLDTAIRAVAGMESFSQVPTGLDVYIKAKASLLALLTVQTGVEDWTAFHEALAACAGSGPYIGIGFRQEGLIAGKRVKGQLSSYRDDPYEGLNEVWIWSGS